MAKKQHYGLVVILWIVLLGATFSSPVSAQESSDTSATEADTIIRSHSPKKATIFSAVLPGLGQVYNKKVWKVPIIYAGFGALGYFISFNNRYYQKFKSAYQMRLNNDPNFNNVYPEYAYLTDQSIELAMNTYRRWRDLNAMGFIALYVLQVIDANVDANFFYYDIGKDITLKVRPGIVGNDNLLGYALGLKINLHF